MLRSLLSVAAVAALAPGANAQLRQADALVTWWAQGTCSGDPRTHVISPQGFCQRVPNAAAFPGYKVSCDAGGAGTITYCRDYPSCSDCPITQPVQPKQCVPNDPVRFGNAGITVTCPARGTGDILVDEVTNLRPSHVEINWFENPGCGAAGGANAFFRSIVVPETGLCQFVPNAPGAEGYRVFCNADGSGVYQTCIDRNCATCTTAAPFKSEQCLDNPPSTGSASVSFRCPGSPAPALVPFVPN